MIRYDEIERKTPAQVELMRAAGQVVARTLAKVRAAIAPGVSTGELDELAYDAIVSEGGKPSFLGYYGYPSTICASVNNQVVHAIPSRNQVLRAGDVISVDCGAILDGWHGDAAFTVIVPGTMPGTMPDPAVVRMIEVCEQAMWAGIDAMRAGNHLSDIGYAIQHTVRRAGKYGVVREYGGHGIGTEMHQDPHVLNYGKQGKGPMLRPGVVLAIEPMITQGSAKVRELADGWTVITKDGSWAAHTEHTVAITAGEPDVLTRKLPA